MNLKDLTPTERKILYHIYVNGYVVVGADGFREIDFKRLKYSRFIYQTFEYDTEVYGTMKTAYTFVHEVAVVLEVVIDEMDKAGNFAGG